MKTVLYKKEVNLFTVSKNVNNETVNIIETTIQRLKNVKIKGDITDFTVYIYKIMYDVDIDTFSYITQMYSFNEVVIETDYKNKMRCKSTKDFGEYKSLIIYSEPISINLLPNDVKSLISEK